MRTRIWNLRFNLDEFNQACALLGDDTSRGAFMRGMSLGMNGGAPQENAQGAFTNGYLFGLSARQEACEHQQRMAKGGRASAESRKTKYGSAAPNNARTMLEQCSNDVRTSPERCPNQSTIDNLGTYSLEEVHEEDPPRDVSLLGTRTPPVPVLGGAA